MRDLRAVVRSPHMALKGFAFEVAGRVGLRDRSSNSGWLFFKWRGGNNSLAPPATQPSLSCMFRLSGAGCQLPRLHQSESPVVGSRWLVCQYLERHCGGGNPGRQRSGECHVSERIPVRLDDCVMGTVISPVAYSHRVELPYGWRLLRPSAALPSMVTNAASKTLGYLRGCKHENKRKLVSPSETCRLTWLYVRCISEVSARSEGIKYAV